MTAPWYFRAKGLLAFTCCHVLAWQVCPTKPNEEIKQHVSQKTSLNSWNLMSKQRIAVTKSQSGQAFSDGFRLSEKTSWIRIDMPTLYRAQKLRKKTNQEVTKKITRLAGTENWASLKKRGLDIKVVQLINASDTASRAHTVTNPHSKYVVFQASLTMSRLYESKTDGDRIQKAASDQQTEYKNWS